MDTKAAKTDIYQGWESSSLEKLLGSLHVDRAVHIQAGRTTVRTDRKIDRIQNILLERRSDLS